MDPAKLEAALSPRTKAIIPVHLYGQMADLDPILEIARRHGIPVVEDACQAHGATYRGRAAGTLGIAGAFSFYPGKNLGALGEAGATVTHDAALARKMATLRDHGQQAKYHHTEIGWNARVAVFHAVITGTINKSNDVRILFDSSGLPEVRQLRSFVLTLLDRTAELGERDHGNVELLCQRFQAARNL